MSTKGSVKPASPLELVSVAGGLVQPLPCRRLPHDAPALGGAEGTSLEMGRCRVNLPLGAHGRSCALLFRAESDLSLDW